MLYSMVHVEQREAQSAHELNCLLRYRSRGARLSKMRLPDRDTRVLCSGDVAKELAAAAAARDRSPGVGCASSAALSRVSPEASSARAAIFIQDIATVELINALYCGTQATSFN